MIVLTLPSSSKEGWRDSVGVVWDRRNHKLNSDRQRPNPPLGLPNVEQLE